MQDPDVSDPRKQAILQSAWQAFAAYGVRKTSMDDIARGAGISRPALYLHYRNKTDILRSLTAFYFVGAEASFAQALAQPGPVGDVLAAAFIAKSGEIIETMLTSPHGRELLEANHAGAADIVEAGEARLRAILAGWLTQKADAGQLMLPSPAEEVARVALTAIKGLMDTADGYDAYARDLHVLGQLLGQGLARR